ncbi:hypothetical protein F5878DRAFT_664135 [Lentinula raphanica]|uniref:Cytochrome c oxidase assembly factor 3 n=1 Tax=Lentinula raphanica TaxID=153919 RepID=A0AA38P2K1_9AGAR|nr:hypothetical protein F5880DRAFT_1611049 [Lentinula raphanica]KAJ3835147.1 hypothetical protein F5878DRAFT_664135 [Lentinula raphanica]
MAQDTNTTSDTQPASDCKPNQDFQALKMQRAEVMQRRKRHIFVPGYQLIQKKTWKKMALGVTGVIAFSALSMYVSEQHSKQRRNIENKIYDQVIARKSSSKVN